MLARMKARRREYAERQLAFSKVMLVKEIKTRKYNIKIGKDNTCHFVFCPDKVTEILKQNLYWSEQVESLGGNIKGELMVGLKRKEFREIIPIRAIHGQYGINYWSFAEDYGNGGFLMVPRLVGKEINCMQLFGEQCGFVLVDFFYHDWTKGVYNTLYQKNIPFSESRRIILNAKMRGRIRLWISSSRGSKKLGYLDSGVFMRLYDLVLPKEVEGGVCNN